MILDFCNVHYQKEIYFYMNVFMPVNQPIQEHLEFNTP